MRVLEEGGAAGSLFIPGDLDEGDAGGVGDRNVKVISAPLGKHILVLALACPAEEPPAASLRNPTQLLDVDVDQFAGTLTLIADSNGIGSGRSRRVESSRDGAGRAKP